MKNIHHCIVSINKYKHILIFFINLHSTKMAITSLKINHFLIPDLEQRETITQMGFFHQD